MLTELTIALALAQQQRVAPPTPNRTERPQVAAADEGTAATGTRPAPGEPAAPPAPSGPRAPQWVDHDGDGRLDLWLMEPGEGDRLLAGRGGGRFVDVTDASGLGTRRASLAAAWTDYDGDGRADLFRVDHRGRGELWRNLGGGAFVRTGAETGLAALGELEGARWIDFDRDGRVDLELATAGGTRLFAGSRSGAFTELVLERGAAATGDGAAAADGTHGAPATEAEGGGGPDGRPAERGELAAGRPVQAPPGAAPPGAPARPSGPGGGFGVSATSAGTGPGVAGGLVSPGVAGCADTVVDVATSTCVEASSDPQIGKLYPLGPELNIDSMGNVGIGTTTPGHHVHVEDASTTGTLLHVESTALSGDVIAIRGTTEGETGTGVTGRNKATAGVNYGVHGRARSVDGRGVFGEAVSLTGAAVGVEGRSEADAGIGVSGYAASTTGTNHGVHGRQEGTSGAGVLGEALNALGYADGVVGTTASPSGAGVRGEHSATTGAGPGVQGLTFSGDASARGVWGLAIGPSANVRYGVYGDASGAAGVGVYGRGADGIGVQGTSGVGTGVLGSHDDATGTAAGVLGRTSSTASNAAAVLGEATGASGQTYGIHGQSASSSGVGVRGDGQLAGVYGESSSSGGAGLSGINTSTSGVNWGLYAQASSDQGRGVQATAINPSGATVGVEGRAYSTAGTGVLGTATASSGGTLGVKGLVDSTSGIGVKGEATAATGGTVGVSGVASSSTGIGVQGLASSSTGFTWGVLATAYSTSGRGVRGLASSASGSTIGVEGVAASDAGIGVKGDGGLWGGYFQGRGYFSGELGIGELDPTHALTVHSQDDDALRLLGPDSPGLDFGARLNWGDGDYVYIEEDVDDHLEIYGRLGTRITGASSSVAALTVRQNVTGPLLKCDAGGPTLFEVQNDGRVLCKVLEIQGGADLVESFGTGGEALEPGTVLVIDPERPGELAASTRSYDSKVAGVVSGAGGVRPGIELSQEGVVDGDTLVAMTGRVYVRCSAENGPIRPGDRLTTAGLAGHAMRATDPERCDGAVLGKAMTALDEGTGLVLVLVNLQ